MLCALRRFDRPLEHTNRWWDRMFSRFSDKSRACALQTPIGCLAQSICRLRVYSLVSPSPTLRQCLRARRTLASENNASANNRNGVFQLTIQVTKSTNVHEIGRASCRERVCQYV